MHCAFMSAFWEIGFFHDKVELRLLTCVCVRSHNTHITVFNRVIMTFHNVHTPQYVYKCPFLFVTFIVFPPLRISLFLILFPFLVMADS